MKPKWSTYQIPWEQKDISWKFFSNALFLVSGLMRQTSDWPIVKSIVQASSISAHCTILSPLIRWFWMSLSSKELKKLLLRKPASWNSFPKAKEPQPRLGEGLAHRLRARSASPSGCSTDWSWFKRRSHLSRAWRPPCTSWSGLVEPSWAPSPWGHRTAPRTSWPKCHRTPSGNAAPPSRPAGWNWRSQAPWPPSWTMVTSRARRQLIVLGSRLLPPPALGVAGSQGPAWGAAERGMAPLAAAADSSPPITWWKWKWSRSVVSNSLRPHGL